MAVLSSRLTSRDDEEERREKDLSSKRQTAPLPGRNEAVEIDEV